jgi:hypothetical protein
VDAKSFTFVYLIVQNDISPIAFAELTSSKLIT